MNTNLKNQVSKRFTSMLILLALLSATVIPAFGQTKRKPRLRRHTRTVVRTVSAPAPEVVYHNVNANQVIRVRMNRTITSETARVGDQFATTTVVPIYAGGVEVIPAGSEIVGRVVTVCLFVPQAAVNLSTQFVDR